MVDNSADKVAARSEELFRQGLFCAESVLQAVAEAWKIDNPLIPRMATGFCSGIARTSGLCGAVGGAILAINLLHGRDDSTRNVDRNYQIVRDFLSRFEKEFGTTNCYQLIGCHLGTPEGQAAFKENDKWNECLVFTREATRLAVSAISAAAEEGATHG